MDKDIVAKRWYVVGAPWLSSDQIPYIVAGREDPHVGVPVVDIMDLDEWDADHDFDHNPFALASHIVDLHNNWLESTGRVLSNESPVSDSPAHDADIWKTVAGYAASDVVALRDALLRLTNLKAHKDEHGKTDYYLANQPLAWRQALDALSREGVQTEPVANGHEQ